MNALPPEWDGQILFVEHLIGLVSELGGSEAYPNAYLEQ